jgi:hypothetical protein
MSECSEVLQKGPEFLTWLLKSSASNNTSAKGVEKAFDSLTACRSLILGDNGTSRDKWIRAFKRSSALQIKT